MTTYCSDPFEGDINPGTTNGQTLYTLATSDRNKDDFLTIVQEHAADITSAFRHDTYSFGWGKLINNVQDATGKTLPILEDFQLVILRLVKQQAVITWNHKFATATSVFPVKMDQINITPEDTTKHDDLKTFYRRVRSKMIAKMIESSLTTSSWKTLFSNRKHFTAVNSDGIASYDGPTMLKLSISSVDPSVI